MADNQASTSSQQQVRLMILSVPRSASTVFTKCLSFVGDSVTIMEPYETAYVYGPDTIFKTQLSEALAAFEEKASQLNLEYPPMAHDESLYSYKWVKEQLEGAYTGKRLVLCKDLAYAITGHENFLPNGFRYVFLLRHPLKVFPSWKKMSTDFIGNTELDKMPHSIIPTGKGYKELIDLLDHVRDKHDQEAIIIDADDLLENPKGILPALFKAIGLPFDEKILNWEAGDDITKTWIISKIFWAGNQVAHYYKNALDSTCFLKPRGLPDRSSLSPDILRCVDASMMYYEKMYAQRLKAY